MPDYRYMMIAKKIQTEIESGNLLPGMPVPARHGRRLRG